MDYLARYSDIRRDPRLLLDGAQSMLVAAFAYAPTPDRRSRLIADYAPATTTIQSSASACDPWHNSWRASTKVRQREFASTPHLCASACGLPARDWGSIGLNNQLIIPGIGSRVFLAEIL